MIARSLGAPTAVAVEAALDLFARIDALDHVVEQALVSLQCLVGVDGYPLGRSLLTYGTCSNSAAFFFARSPRRS